MYGCFYDTARLPRRTEHDSFFDINNSQGSVATRLKFGKLFNHKFIEHMLLSVSLSVK